MHKILDCPTTANPWRCETRCDGALLRCGAALTERAAKSEVDEMTSA